MAKKKPKPATPPSGGLGQRPPTSGNPTRQHHQMASHGLKKKK